MTTTPTSGAADLPEAGCSKHHLIHCSQCRHDNMVRDLRAENDRLHELVAGQATAAQPVAEPAGAVSEMVKFTDQSTANPIEKARRYLAHVANKKPNNPYFFDDGYPRESIADDAAAALSVLEQLAASRGQAPAQAASSAVLKAIREANMQLVRTGDDAFMLVPYKAVTAQAAESVTAPGGGVVAGRFMDEAAERRSAQEGYENRIKRVSERNPHDDGMYSLGWWDRAWKAAAPTPAAQAADSVQDDAARYRWLRDGNDAKHGAAWHVAVNLYGFEWDAAIDAARKQGATQ